MLLLFALISKDPGGLTDYIAAEYIPDFLGGPYEVGIRTPSESKCLMALYIHKPVFESLLNIFMFFLFVLWQGASREKKFCVVITTRLEIMAHQLATSPGPSCSKPD